MLLKLKIVYVGKNDYNIDTFNLSYNLYSTYLYTKSKLAFVKIIRDAGFKQFARRFEKWYVN